MAGKDRYGAGVRLVLGSRPFSFLVSVRVVLAQLEARTIGPSPDEFSFTHLLHHSFNICFIIRLLNDFNVNRDQLFLLKK